eukprot:TRINITY_DN33421_c0_g1_i1.p3 TRINITY_DN33421_c0_g1~~TRINITY_DN33421_c0_g1_i1.p3  ORF type:complete len:110 (+),score=39.53 TRINITY_DN33421_c0_g1_i1:62-391(+)
MFMIDSIFFFFKQKTAYEMLRSLVGSEMCIRDRACTGPYARLVQDAVGKLGRSVLRDPGFCTRLCGGDGWNVAEATTALAQYLPGYTQSELRQVVQYLDTDADLSLIHI